MIAASLLVLQGKTKGTLFIVWTDDSPSAGTRCLGVGEQRAEGGRRATL